MIRVSESGCEPCEVASRRVAEIGSANGGTGARIRRTRPARQFWCGQEQAAREIKQALQAATLFLEVHWLDFHKPANKTSNTARAVLTSNAVGAVFYDFSVPYLMQRNANQFRVLPFDTVGHKTKPFIESTCSIIAV